MPGPINVTVGTRVQGWFDKRKYAGTVTSIGTRLSEETTVTHITVTEDDGTEHHTYSDAITLEPA